MPLDPSARNIVVIGGSAGGTEALLELVARWPADLPAAVLAVIHIPAATPSRLRDVLAARTALRVVVGADGDNLEPGCLYVASADRHLMLDVDGIRLTRGPKECRARPSIDVLFRSAAIAFGPRVIGIVLSGTLDDGTAGLWSIKDRGGLAFVQEPSEAQYDAMPRSAMTHVSTDGVDRVAALAGRIGTLLGAAVYEPRPSDQREGLLVENRIAMEGNGLKAGVMDLGLVSKYTCPDCHGVLVQIEEGSIVRFRCHTGHAFTMQTLVAEVNAAIDTGLWDTVRAVEERVMLLRQMAQQVEPANPGEARRLGSLADQSEERLQPLRALVLDDRFFGHDD